MRKVRILLCLGLLGTLAACGGGGSANPGSPGTPSVPTPEPLGPATRSVLDLRNWQLKGGAGAFYNQDRLPEGTLDVTMEWGNGDIPVSVYVTEANSCPDTTSVRTGACRILAQSNDPKVKPKRINYTVPTGKPSVAVWVVNEGRQTTDGSVEVGITSQERPATPNPNATPTPSDPRASLPDGPVATAFIKVRSIDTGGNRYRDPFQDRDGYWILHQGEFVVFDLTQKNANGQECKWVNDPVWDVEDKGYVFIIRGSSQPFLLRADVDKAEGFINVQGRIDGIESNILKIKVTKDN
jgi:hypothetical protein